MDISNFEKAIIKIQNTLSLPSMFNIPQEIIETNLEGLKKRRYLNDETFNLPAKVVCNKTVFQIKACFVFKNHLCRVKMFTPKTLMNIRKMDFYR